MAYLAGITGEDYVRTDGRGCLSDEAKGVIIKLYTHPKKLKIASVVRVARLTMDDRGRPITCSDQTIRNWLRGWIEGTNDISDKKD
jgi:hypothetical protein